jgi:DNA-binding MarR family transcriptional regulator
MRLRSHNAKETCRQPVGIATDKDAVAEGVHNGTDIAGGLPAKKATVAEYIKKLKEKGEIEETTK